MKDCSRDLNLKDFEQSIIAFEQFHVLELRKKKNAILQCIRMIITCYKLLLIILSSHSYLSVYFKHMELLAAGLLDR
jgi:hypothetical protein